MSYEYTITPQDGYLLYITSGVLDDVESLLACTGIALQEAMAKECNLLIDDRRLTINLSNLDATLTGEHLAEIDLQVMGIRIASVQSPENMELGRMFETVLTNRSLVFKVFEDRESAINWLNSD